MTQNTYELIQSLERDIKQSRLEYDKYTTLASYQGRECENMRYLRREIQQWEARLAQLRKFM